MAGANDGRRLSVWHWSGRDRVSLYDLEFLVAAGSRHEWRQTVLRLRLPDWKDAGALAPGDPRTAVAVADPGRLFWRELGASTDWSDEAAFAHLRASSTARELSAGRYSDPLHRRNRR
ncbi:hypothetical protein GB931_14200 [Modestobacter sp. I12A-02628]|uniref:Uncharacterized protein n=1 Tax=Goekera deserti TaxID=2497753 RepID=A0A7K3WHR7_9ACTN|nr:hypothetical protein [Goekera deserti]MPQ99052.1 hypothetical protein [Goekera deserti]NDI47386.1 hypothetical protein [Goekera deserti]NEL55916.1 hypothetical protein [Goekera deserti]